MTSAVVTLVGSSLRRVRLECYSNASTYGSPSESISPHVILVVTRPSFVRSPHHLQRVQRRVIGVRLSVTPSADSKPLLLATAARSRRCPVPPPTGRESVVRHRNVRTKCAWRPSVGERETPPPLPSLLLKQLYCRTYAYSYHYYYY